jgi:release factor glutamine methyltransferase
VDLTGINRRPADLAALSDGMLAASQDNVEFPYDFEVLGTPLVAFANVFSPPYMPGAETFTRMLPLAPGIDFLEIGAGTGAIAVLAALGGAARVVATDINPDAVANTRANIDRHGLGGVMEAREGDVFDPIRPGERFDLVFWNIPFAFVEPGTAVTPLQRSTLDPGYASMRRYITEGPRHLKPGGLLTLGFSTTLGRMDLVEEIAAGAGLEARIAHQQPATPEMPIAFELIHLVPRE